MRKMTDKQINRAILNVKATLAIEGLSPSNTTLNAGERYLRGEITSKEAIGAITTRILAKKERIQGV